MATFVHVVEDQYLLRLCPCGGSRRHEADAHPWICDCDYGSGKTHCSKILHANNTVQDVGGTGGSKVSEVCKTPFLTSSSASEKATSDEHEFLKIDSPGTMCSSVLLTGTLTSCTPIQEYDRVRINFFQLGEFHQICWVTTARVKLGIYIGHNSPNYDECQTQSL